MNDTDIDILGHPKMLYGNIEERNSFEYLTHESVFPSAKNPHSVKRSVRRWLIVLTFSPCTLMTFIFKRPTRTQLF